MSNQERVDKFVIAAMNSVEFESKVIGCSKSIPRDTIKEYLDIVNRMAFNAMVLSNNIYTDLPKPGLPEPTEIPSEGPN